jgi:hypothetical protein
VRESVKHQNPLDGEELRAIPRYLRLRESYVPWSAGNAISADVPVRRPPGEGPASRA